jgi:hypothetical protein
MQNTLSGHISLVKLFRRPLAGFQEILNLAESIRFWGYLHQIRRN